jgi:TonB family protein
MSLYASAALPWTVTAEDEERFQRILKRILTFFILLCLIMPFLPLPKVDRQEPEELPPRIAKLMIEQHVAPLPPPVKQPEAEVVKSKPEVAKVEPKPKPKEITAKKIEKPPVEKNIETARKRASRSGLLAFKDELADLRDNPVSANLPKNVKPGPGVGPGKGPGVGSTSGPAMGAGARAIITARATTGSGGINTSKLSYGTGGGGLAGRSTTKVNSPIGGGGGAGGRLTRGGDGQASRSIEEIKLIFDKNKAAIYALYNRALREDPTLQGKVILKLTITPSGQVTSCEIVSSELRVPDLERKLAARVRLFDFGAKAVGVMVVTYPIDFLPS